MSEEDDLPRVLSGRYRLEATLGHGGMGVVYRGTDLVIKRPIAVKLIRAVAGVELDDEIAGRFLREAKNTARLHHEHIIELFDLGRSEEGGLYFVMELLEGESLSARLRRERRLAPETSVHIGVQICRALQVAHASGVIHRDLKPANVMLVSRAGNDDFVKVLDFGVAKSLSGDQQTQLTHTGMLVGTIDYMAPEQIMGRPVDGRTDIYALGIVLYRMLSGRSPFRDGGVPALIHAHLNTMPRPLCASVGNIPIALDQVVLRCLAKDPGERFESMAELAEALTASLVSARSALDGEPDVDGEPDIYDEGDRTMVAAVGPRAPSVPAFSDPRAADETTGRHLTDATFDDTTIRLGAPVGSRPPPPVFAPRIGAVNPDDISTLDRPVQETTLPVGRGGPRACAMCRTANAPTARACAACGVSLPVDVHEPSASHPTAAGTPTPGGIPWLVHPSMPNDVSSSIWRRFLHWTGLRGR